MKEEANKFIPTRAWRKRQRLDRLITQVEDALGCLVHSRDKKQFDRENFEFSLEELEIAVPKLARFYRRNK